MEKSIKIFGSPIKAFMAAAAAGGAWHPTLFMKIVELQGFSLKDFSEAEDAMQIYGYLKELTDIAADAVNRYSALNWGDYQSVPPTLFEIMLEDEDVILKYESCCQTTVTAVIRPLFFRVRDDFGIKTVAKIDGFLTIANESGDDEENHVYHRMESAKKVLSIKEYKEM